jgi:hypothetical protein
MEVLLSTVLKLYVDSYEVWDNYLGPRDELNFHVLITDLLSFLILFNYIVPISLYVTIGKPFPHFVFLSILSLFHEK